MQVHKCSAGHLRVGAYQCMTFTDHFPTVHDCDEPAERITNPEELMEYAESMQNRDRSMMHAFADAALFALVEQHAPELAERYNKLCDNGQEFWYA